MNMSKSRAFMSFGEKIIRCVYCLETHHDGTHSNKVWITSEFDFAVDSPKGFHL